MSLTLLAPALLCAGSVATSAPHDRGVNLFTYNAQETPSIAVDASGHALVAWGSRRQEAGSFGIFARLLDPAGEPIGPEIDVNTWWPNNQEAPSVAFDGAGRAWIAWRSHAQDGHLGTIAMRVFELQDGAFVAVTAEDVIVNTTAAGDQREPVVAAGPDGAVIAWSTTDADGAHAIAARCFDRDGAPRGDEFIVAGGTLERGAHKASAVATASGIVVAWTERNAEQKPVIVAARIIDAATGALTPRVELAARDERRHLEPALTVTADGGLAAAWMATGDFGGYDVIVRRFDAALQPLDASRIVSTAGAWRSGAAIAGAPDGTFAVSWNEFTAASPEQPGDLACDVRVQRFGADGTPLGTATTAHAATDGRQALSLLSGAQRTAFAPDGALLHAWHGRTATDGKGVGVSRLGGAEVVAQATAVTIDPALAAQRITPEMVATAMAETPPVFDPNFVPDPPDPPTLGPGPDFGFVGFQATGWNPPDPDLAVGPNHVVVVVNGGIRFYQKTGAQTFSTTIAGSGGFWGEVGATSFVFDPVAVYDTVARRYIVAATEHSDSGQDVVLLAVSDDQDPNGTWHKYRFDLSSVGGFIDFPNLGVDGDAIYVCTDFFDTPTGNHIHAFDKAAALAGDPVTVNSIQTSSGFRSLAAVTSYDNDAPAAYFATSHGVSSTQIQLDAVVDPLGSALRSTFNLTVPSYGDPPGAPQAGSTNLVSTVGRRIKHGVYRNGRLWLAHTIGQAGTARVRWYEVDPRGWPSSGQTPVLIQSGTINPGSGIHTWFPDIHVDANGNVGIAFNQSSSDEFVSVRRSFRLAGDPAGTMRDPVLMQISSSPEEGDRWGDYAGVEEDPIDASVFWSHHEYRTTSWRTWVGRFDIFDGLASFSFAFPNGRPEFVASDGTTELTVSVLDQSGAVDPGSVTLHVDDGSSVHEVAMAAQGGNFFTGAFPVLPCGTAVSWWVSGEDDGGTEFTDPVDAPASAYETSTVDAIVVAFDDDFEADFGWTVSGNATDGEWERGVPAGAGDRGDPTEDADGSGQCYLTDNQAGNTDVDGGSTILTSRALDASAPGSRLGYWRWYDNTAGAAPEADVFTVEVSDNDGATWTTLEVVGPGGDEVAGGWFWREFAIADFVSETTTFKVRFIAADEGDGSVVEAAVDGVRIRSVECADACTGDLDRSGSVDFNDLVSLLGSWGPCVGCPADLDDDDSVNFNDLLILLGAWGACP